MGNICAQKEHAHAMPHELTMRRGAGGSQLMLNLSSLGWSTALPCPLEVCDGKLWCPVPSTAGHQSGELSLVLLPVPWVNLGIPGGGGGDKRWTECFISGAGYVGPQMSFLWYWIASAAEPVQLERDIFLVSPHTTCQPLRERKREREHLSAHCASLAASVYVCCTCAWEMLPGGSLCFSKKKSCATSERSP